MVNAQATSLDNISQSPTRNEGCGMALQGLAGGVPPASLPEHHHSCACTTFGRNRPQYACRHILAGPVRANRVPDPPGWHHPHTAHAAQLHGHLHERVPGRARGDKSEDMHPLIHAIMDVPWMSACRGCLHVPVLSSLLPQFGGLILVAAAHTRNVKTASTHFNTWRATGIQTLHQALGGLLRHHVSCCTLCTQVTGNAVPLPVPTQTALLLAAFNGVPQLFATAVTNIAEPPGLSTSFVTLVAGTQQQPANFTPQVARIQSRWH